MPRTKSTLGNKKNPGKRSRNIFDPASSEPFRLSRTKLDDFLKCPRCFYLDRRLGVSAPGFPPYLLNSAVDKLLKNEFDIHRAKGSAHPLMEKYGIDAVPFDHEKLDEWRNNFQGARHLHKPTNLIITGAVDDIWVNPDGDLIVVDYKATCTTKEITLEDKYKQSFKRQIEVYQWILRQEGFKVSDIGYFVFANAQEDREAFDKKLEFEVLLVEHRGNDAWVEETIIKARKCLLSDKLPDYNPDCDYCNYRRAASEAEGDIP